MKAIIIEDSRLARLELNTMLCEFEQIEVIAQAAVPDEGIALIKQHQPEVLFLDIQMPGKNGFELLDEIDFQGKVIFTTAYDEYAIRSFDYDAFDYLLKPIETDRLAVTINKLIRLEASESTPQDTEQVKFDENSSVFLKDGDECDFVPLKDIFLIESCSNYCFIHHKQQKPLIKKSLNLLEARLPETLFFRANRQQIINLRQVRNVDIAVNGNLLITLHSGHEVEASRRHSSRFKQLMSF
ncbi:LytTR family transcriptional regulator DNA-binding domain-containing protein [Pseudoalteromonas sp. BZB3]|uniref:LytR/AlgR family response regulator transcription factor n=1 Tax=Pseudoalteromonas sp. BZB3 TaxID=3136670 RepID=UPI0032C46C0C